MGYETASHMTLFTAVSEVVSGVFGDGETKPDKVEDLTKLDTNQYAARFEQLMSL